MKKYYLHHHLGLGDHFVCNGLVRHFFNEYGNVSIFSKSHNFETVKFMYRDNENIEVIRINTDYDVNYYMSNFTDPNLENILIQVGFDNLWKNYTNPEEPLYSPSENFDERFYHIMGLNFELRWDLFNCERDLDVEKNFFQNFNLRPKEYIFVHDDDRFQINMDRIDTHLQVIKPEKIYTSNIFDYCFLIENALEVHTIESSFSLMIDSLNLNKEFYIHRYARTDNPPIFKHVKQILL